MPKISCASVHVAFAQEFIFVCVFDFIHNVSSVFLVRNIHLRKICFHFLSSELAKIFLAVFFLWFVKFCVKRWITNNAVCMYFQSSASQEHCHNLGPVSWWQVAIHHYGVRDWRMSERLSQSTRSYADLASPRQNGELFHYFVMASLSQNDEFLCFFLMALLCQNGELFHYFVMASLSQSDEFLYFFLRALLCQNDELFHYFVMTSPCQNGGTFTNQWNYLSVYIEVHWYFHQSVNHLDAYINFRYIGTFTSLLIILSVYIHSATIFFKVCLFGTSADSHLAGVRCSADLHPVLWLSFCWFQCAQVADGMAFLHSTKPPIIHRDLRCGNLFLSDNDVVKVCMHVRCLASTDDTICVCFSTPCITAVLCLYGCVPLSLIHISEPTRRA